ncbi:MAG TPA: hypothetical protein VJ858_03525 [Acidimicrobiia bacterium]|nr:hypothetical protein [Acidimicrobiia bacterium]
MRLAALISQPLRVLHCLAYLDDGSDDNVVLTANPAVFAEVKFASPTRVVAVSPPTELLPTVRLARGRLYRRLVDMARSGSELGRRLERFAKRIMWRLRYFDRLVILKRRRKPQQLTQEAVQNSSLYRELVEEHMKRPFDKLIVFDVFDLPVAMEFSDTYAVEVLVR